MIKDLSQHTRIDLVLPAHDAYLMSTKTELYETLTGNQLTAVKHLTLVFEAGEVVTGIISQLENPALAKDGTWYPVYTEVPVVIHSIRVRE